MGEPQTTEARARLPRRIVDVLCDAGLLDSADWRYAEQLVADALRTEAQDA